MYGNIDKIIGEKSTPKVWRRVFNANVPPEPLNGIQQRNLGDNARTINEQGVTIVPLDVHVLDNGDIYIRAKPAEYATPGPDEAQTFDEMKPIATRNKQAKS